MAVNIIYEIMAVNYEIACLVHVRIMRNSDVKSINYLTLQGYGKTVKNRLFEVKD